MKLQKRISLFLIFCLFFQFITGQAVAFSFWKKKTEKVEKKVSHNTATNSFKEAVREEPTEITIQEGHTAGITGANFSRDGKIIVTSSRDNTIKFWNREGLLIKTVDTKMHNPRTMMSPDGNFILAAGFYSNELKLWDSEGKFLHKIKGLRAGRVQTIAFSPASNLIVAANAFNELMVWDVGGHIFRKLKKTASEVYAIAFSPDSRLMVTGETNGIMRFWDLDQGKQIRQVQVTKGMITSLTFASDGGCELK